jgi:2-oxoglutarate ferredoxin oxidoreductase subunit gamma
MTANSYKKYGDDVHENTISIVDSYFIDELKDCPGRSYLLPISDTAVEVTGRIIVANIVAVGVLAALVDPISVAGIQQAVKNRVPKGTEDINLQALQAGIEMGRKVLVHCRSGSGQCKLALAEI